MAPHRILGLEQRHILIAESGDPLTKYGLDTAWKKVITAAMAGGVIAQTKRFNLHGLKHRGISDTPVHRADRQQGSGYKCESMLDTHDYEPAVAHPVKMPGLSREFSGVSSLSKKPKI